MNEQFYTLSQEKQMRIINAGLEVFSQNDYKHAVTDEIARKAGISKGLLFYYFHNKQSLYHFLFNYCADMVTEHVVNAKPPQSTDFFLRLQCAAEAKMHFMESTPYLMDFLIRCFYSEEDAAAKSLNTSVFDRSTQIFGQYFENVDYTKFKKDVDYNEIYQMLLWLEEGYLFQRKKMGLPFSLPEMMEQYRRWESYMKQIAYKEEFLVEGETEWKKQ